MAAVDRAARLALNESRFRDINERVARDIEPVAEGPDDLVPFVCECARIACDAGVELTLAEFERVRGDSTQFALVPGHELLDVEDVVERHDRYVVVRKHPETRDIAIATDDRL